MAIQFKETNDGKVLEVQVNGKLTHADYEHFVPEFERLLKAHGNLRVLFNMADFHGWEMKALWDDIKFDLQHFSDIEKLGMVGDARWEKWMAVFCQPFTSARIKFFLPGEETSARQWLALEA